VGTDVRDGRRVVDGGGHPETVDDAVDDAPPSDFEILLRVEQ